MTWFFLHLFGAIAWFLFMSGAVPSEPWVVTGAFFLLGVHSLIGAIKSVVEQ